MKLPKSAAIWFCCMLIVGNLLAQTKKVRVVTNTTNIYIEPHNDSTVIGTVPKGTILTLFDSGSQEKSWYYISFYSEEKWATLTGFVAASQVEIIGTPAPKPPEKKPVPPKKKVPEKRPPPNPAPTQPPEKKKSEPAAPTVVPVEPEQAAELNLFSGELKIVGEKPAVRSSASASGRILVVAKFAEVLELTGKQGEWYRVNYPRAEGIVLVGFIHQDQTEVMSSVALEGADLEASPEPDRKEKPEIVVEDTKLEPVAPEKTAKEQAVPPSEKSFKKPLIFESGILGVGLHAGYGMPFDSGSNGGFSYGAGVSYLVTPHLGVELSLIRYRSEVAGSDSGLSKGRLTHTPLTFSFLGRYPIKDRLVPYAALGATFSLNSFEICRSCLESWDALGMSVTESVDNTFGWHLGVGLDYHVTRRIAINVDVRGHFLKGQGAWSMADQMSDVSVSGDLTDLNMNTWVFRFGAKFYFKLF